MPNNYFLKNYDLTRGQVAQSFFVSEYALRHLSQAKASHDWKGRVVHGLIGAVELIPLLGPIGSILERACFSVVQNKQANLTEKSIASLNEKTASQQTKKVGLISRILGLTKEKGVDKPFETYWDRNETIPKFKHYAQGIFSIKTDELIPSNLREEVSEIEISFLHQDKEFYKETVSATQPNIDTFLMNLPFGKEVSVQFTAKKKDGSTQILEPLSFQADQVYGTYRAGKKETGWETESSQLNKPVQWYLGAAVQEKDNLKKIYKMGAINFERPLDIEINQGELNIDTHSDQAYDPHHKIPYPVYKDIKRSDDEHYVFVNKMPQMQVLNLVFSVDEHVSSLSVEDEGPVLTRSIKEHLFSLSIVIPPDEKKSFSKQIFLDQLKDACQKLNIKSPLSEEDISLFYIQHLQYSMTMEGPRSESS